MSLNSRCPSWFHSNSLLLNSIHFNGRHQKSYQEKKQTIFSGTSLRTHLCARSSCCFHQISKDDLLYSFCFSLLIIQSQQSARIFLQREGHLVIEPAYFPVLSRTSLSFVTGGRHPHLASGLDFWNALDSSKAPACLSTVNPHGPSVSFTDSLVKKKKYKTQCKIQIRLGSTFGIRLPWNLLQLFAELYPCSPKFLGTSGVSQFWIKPDDSSLSKDSQKPIKQICKRIKWRKLFWTQNRIFCNTEIVLFPNFLSWKGQKVNSFCLKTTHWLYWWQSLEIGKNIYISCKIILHMQKQCSSWWGDGTETTPEFVVTSGGPSSNQKFYISGTENLN